MATLKQRLRRKNSSGSYDTIYLQTDLSNVTGTLSVSNGGTGATTTSGILSNINGQKQVKIASVTLGTNWQESNGVYRQTVTISGATTNSMIDCQPNDAVLDIMASAGCTGLRFENNSGTISAIARGAAPTESIAVQVSVMEVQ